MKLAILVSVAALSSEALSACANTWDKCELGDPNKCECNGNHIVCHGPFQSIIHLLTKRPHR